MMLRRGGGRGARGGPGRDLRCGRRGAARACALWRPRRGGVAFALAAADGDDSLRWRSPGAQRAQRDGGCWLRRAVGGRWRTARPSGEYRGVRRRLSSRASAAASRWWMTMPIIPRRFAPRWRPCGSAIRRRRSGAVFQPHTYSRTQALFDDYATSFGDADRCGLVTRRVSRASQGASHRGAADLVRGDGAPQCAPHGDAGRC